jgi:hypothetical protein
VALSPGIPTSFVPKQPLQPVTRRPMSSGNNLFLLVSIAIAGLTIVLAIGVFAYNKYLQHTLISKQAELTQAQGKVDDATIEDFVRLRDRLTNGKDLLTNHVVLSHFFDVLESLTLQNVSFSNLTLTVAADHTAQLKMTGTAKNFNALAAQSNAFAGEKRIKRAIFSNINLTSAKLVTFSLTADVDPKLIVEGSSVPSAQSAMPSAPSTAPVTTAPAVPAASTSPAAPATKPATATTTASPAATAKITTP